MRVVIPIIAESMADALRDIDKAEKVADILELRLDFMSNPHLTQLLKHSSLPKIVTNRTKFEGGRFEGTEEKRISYLQEAISLGAEYVDIESDYYFPFKKHSTKIIVSHHNFEYTPDDLNGIYNKIALQNPDIIKIATKANSYEDSLRMLELVHNANRDIIGICMGQYGVITRVLGPLYGSYLTFASLEDGKSSAPGQMSVAELKQACQLLQIK
jgi:3-dehydroquinate dehydratase/shikimate dehydrogenase